MHCDWPRIFERPCEIGLGSGVYSKVSGTTRHSRQSSLEAAFLCNYEALLGFLRRRGAGDDAEDVLQELWLKVRESDAKCRETSEIQEPRAFLYRMAKNLAVDHCRAALRRDSRNTLWVQQHCAEDHPPVFGSCAERTLIAREELSAVERCLDGLGGRASIIFRRFRVDGASHREIAVERGITVSGVEKHLGRCYRVLEEARKTWSDEFFARDRMRSEMRS